MGRVISRAGGGACGLLWELYRVRLHSFAVLCCGVCVCVCVCGWASRPGPLLRFLGGVVLR
ncbi:hypothetical protein GGR67_000778 [Xanthomonas arboricola]|nr:hypothetical protein [Xanthomonas euroxanthea]